MSAEDKPEDEIIPAAEESAKPKKASVMKDDPEPHPFDADAFAVGGSEKSAAAGADKSASSVEKDASTEDAQRADVAPAPEEEAAEADTSEFLGEPGFAESVLAGLENFDLDDAGSPAGAKSEPAPDPAPEPARADAADDASIAPPEDAGDDAASGTADADGRDSFEELPPSLDAAEEDDPLAEPAGVSLDEGEPAFTTFPDTVTVDSISAQADNEAPLADQKHDALAEAVQSALLAVYGEGNYASEASGSEASFSNYEERLAAGLANGDSHDEYDDAERHEPTPQEVILNYFSQSSAASDTAEPAKTAAESYAEAGYIAASRPAPSEPYANVPPPPPPPRPAPRYEERYPEPDYATTYTAPPPPAQTNQMSRGSYPVPAAAPFASLDSGDADLKNSGKLLGAAGLGLVGGIAFAAVLAVFLLNSYAPEEGAPKVAANAPAAAPEQAQQTAAATQPEPEVDMQPTIVASDVTGTAGETVPLRIAVEPAPSNQKTLISITGVPAGGRLSSGVDAGGGNWLLPPKRLRGLTMALPADASGPVQLEVQLLESNVRTPLSEKQAFNVAVAPATAATASAPQATASAAVQTPPASIAQAAVSQPSPAPTADRFADAEPARSPAAAQQWAALPETPNFSTQTVPSSDAQTPAQSDATPSQPTQPTQQAALPASQSPMAEADVQDLIREGNRYMRDGEIIRARSYYEQAARAGHGEAALAMGRSFDPSYFERLDRKTGEPDAAQAFEWYRQAMNAGLDRAAQVRIENLRQWLNR